jgi:hypothetical protein
VLDGTSNTHGRHEQCKQNFWLESLKERDHSQDLDTDGKIILQWTGEDCVMRAS